MQTFVVRLVFVSKYKDEQKTHYPSGRTLFHCASFKTYNKREFVQVHNASSACLYPRDE